MKERLTDRRELEKKIIGKALEDENFKQNLLLDPHGVIAKFGVQIPKHIDIKVLEESARVAYLVLPYNSEELDDDALDLISGGPTLASNEDDPIPRRK